MQIFISIATINDLSNIKQLVNSAYRGEDAKRGWTHEANLIEGPLRIDETTLRSQIERPDAVILKCTDEFNSLVGCVYLEKKGQQLYLGMFAVSPDLQAKGIGKNLLKAAENYAVRNNCHAIEMTVISIRYELIAWYKRYGYKETGMVTPFPENNIFGVPNQPLEFIVLAKEI